MSPIKELKLSYNSLNKENVFSEGDPVTGTVTLTLSDELKVKCVLVKVKGQARVQFSDGTGDRRRHHHAHRRFFKDKQYLVEINDEGTELKKGVHSYNFSLRIPQGNMPSSFTGFHGKIFYTLTAKISRKMHLPHAEEAELHFVSKSYSPGQVMGLNTGSVGKEVGVFSKGQLQFSATVDKKVCSPGDTLSIVAKIVNSSSKKMKPKFSLQQKVVYRAVGARKFTDQSLCKLVGDTLTSKEETASCQLRIPPEVMYSVPNCDILIVEHYLKVYLDISFAIDPDVKLPLIIVPPGHASSLRGEGVGPYSAGIAGGPSCSDFPPPAFAAPYPAPTGPGAYGYPAPAPAQPGYSNPWPQPMAPYGASAAAYPPPMVQQQAPSAPSMFVQEEPPSYTSLYPSINTFDSSGSNEKTEL